MQCVSPLRSIIALLLPLVYAVSLASADDVESIEDRYLTNVRQVTDGYVKAGEGYFSPDGETIVYQAVRAEYPFYQIFTQPLTGGEPNLISTGRGRTTCSYFHPGGSRLMFSSSHNDPALEETEAEARRQMEEDRRTGRRRRYSWVFDAQMDIFEADLDGRNPRRLTDSLGYDAEGAYSSDGELIAFCSDRDGDADIYLMQADGSNVQQITNEEGYDGGPFISPDGRWIVYRTDRKKEEHLQIHVIGIDGQNDTALTDNVGVNWGPYWHPTEPFIIWAGADHSQPDTRPNYDLWMMRYSIENGVFQVDGEWRITDNRATDILPVFSPDGNQLMWTSTRTADGSSQLWIGDFTVPE